MRGSALWLASALAVCACASDDARPPDTLAEVWAEYRELPDQRALAVAGVLQQGRWVSGASGGHKTSAAASESALRECEARRRRVRTPSACRLYAVGDEIVWKGP